MVAITWKWMGGADSIKYHVRSRDRDEEIHCGELSRLVCPNAGGGHPCAAGFSLPSTTSCTKPFDSGADMCKAIASDGNKHELHHIGADGQLYSARYIYTYFEPIAVAEEAFKYYPEDIVAVWKHLVASDRSMYVFVCRKTANVSALQAIYDLYSRKHPSFEACEKESIKLSAKAKGFGEANVIQFTLSKDE